MLENFKKVEILKENIEKEMIESIAKDIDLISKSSKFLGSGRAAKVFTSGDFKYCIKEIIDKSRRFSFNDFIAELEILRDAVSIGVRSPEPLMSLETKDNRQFIVMERIMGPSLDDIKNGRANKPENFNKLEFFNKLSLMVKKMHEGNIYHRDLFEGNVMIDADGGPVIIDFGQSNKAYGSDDPYKEHDFPRLGETQTYTSDEINLELLKGVLDTFK